MDVMVEADRKMQVEKLLRDRDIRFDVTGTKVNGSRNKSPINILGPRPRSPSKAVIRETRNTLST